MFYSIPTSLFFFETQLSKSRPSLFYPCSFEVWGSICVWGFTSAPAISPCPWHQNKKKEISHLKPMFNCPLVSVRISFDPTQTFPSPLDLHPLKPNSLSYMQQKVSILCSEILFVLFDNLWKLRAEKFLHKSFRDMYYCLPNRDFGSIAGCVVAFWKRKRELLFFSEYPLQACFALASIAKKYLPLLLYHIARVLEACKIPKAALALDIYVTFFLGNTSFCHWTTAVLHPFLPKASSKHENNGFSCKHQFLNFSHCCGFQNLKKQYCFLLSLGLQLVERPHPERWRQTATGQTSGTRHHCRTIGLLYVTTCHRWESNFLVLRVAADPLSRFQFSHFKQHP